MLNTLLAMGLLMILAGISLIIIALLSLALSGSKARERVAESGGVLMIGPVPIIFGTSRRAAEMAIVLAIMLIALTTLLMLIPLIRGV